MSQVTFQIGESVITVHSKSDIILRSPSERGEWFRQKLEERDPVVVGMAEASMRIFTSRKPTA